MLVASFMRADYLLGIAAVVLVLAVHLVGEPHQGPWPCSALEISNSFLFMNIIKIL